MRKKTRTNTMGFLTALKKLSELKNLDFNYLEKKTTDNFNKLFFTK